MTAYEWTEAGLIPKLNEKLEFSDNKSDSLSSTRKSTKRKNVNHVSSPEKSEVNKPVKQSVSNEKKRSKKMKSDIPPTVWSRIGALKSKSKTAISKLLAHLSLRLDKETFDFERDGTIQVQGRQVPGSDILKILQSVMNSSELEIGEVLILHLLSHSPKNIKALIHKKKIHFINSDEPNPDDFEPVLRKDRLKADKKRRIGKSKMQTAHGKRRKTLKDENATERQEGAEKKESTGKVNVNPKPIFPSYNPTVRSNALTGKATVPGDNLAAELRKSTPRNRSWYTLTESTAVKPSEFIA